MKRLITFISLIVIILLGYTLITKGFENDKITIASYNTIESKSEALTQKLASYNKRNQEDYETAKSTLETSIKNYKNSKTKYEEIYKELADVLNNPSDETGVAEEVIYSDKEIYRIDFVMVILDRYADKYGVDVEFKVVTSSSVDPSSTIYNYFLANLEFTVTGQYMDVTNFISELENDEDLQWQINNFTMQSGSANGYSGVSAKFVVKSIPIDSKSYIATQSASGNNSENNQSADGSDNTGNTTNTTATDGGNSVANNTDNSVNNSTNSVSNTTSNSVANNTVN